MPRGTTWRAGDHAFLSSRDYVRHARHVPAETSKNIHPERRVLFLHVVVTRGLCGFTWTATRTKEILRGDDTTPACSCVCGAQVDCFVFFRPISFPTKKVNTAYRDHELFLFHHCISTKFQKNALFSQTQKNNFGAVCVSTNHTASFYTPPQYIHYIKFTHTRRFSTRRVCVCVCTRAFLLLPAALPLILE